MAATSDPEGLVSWKKVIEGEPSDVVPLDPLPEFEEGAGEKWLGLLPQKWNKQQLYSWRYDPREFAAGAAPERDPRRANARRCDD